MTVKEFMLKKYPTDLYIECPVPKWLWGDIQQYAIEYHEAMSKNTTLENMACVHPFEYVVISGVEICCFKCKKKLNPVIPTKTCTDKK